MISPLACSCINLLEISTIKDYQPQFYIGGGAGLLAVVILFFFDEKLDMERMEKKGLIVWEDDKKYTNIKS
jgi:hypothetical protein